MDVRFGTWNIRSFHMAGSLITIATGIATYTLDLVSVQEVKWDRRGTEPAEDCTFLYRNGNESHVLRQDVIYMRESYQQLRG
jgi:hypothetical protein